MNDTYMGAWKSIPPQRPNRLATYLGKITRNLAINRFRQYNTQKRGRGQTELVLSELEDCIPSEVYVERHLEEMALVQAIERFLYAQPIQKRNIFIRRYWYLTPIREISQVYGMSESKVASLLFRMRSSLKKQLEKDGIFL